MYALISVAAQKDSGGRFWATFAMIRDVTDDERSGVELKKAYPDLREEVQGGTATMLLNNQKLELEWDRRDQVEKELVASEQRYREMFENNSAVKLLIAPESGQILDANTSAAEFYGYSRDELKNIKITDICLLPAEQALMKLREVAGREITHCVIKQRLRTGEIRNVEIYSGPINVDGRPYLFAIVHDVTAQARAEEALRKSEARFRAVFENTRDLMWMKDLSGRYTRVNPAAQSAAGLTEGQIIGKTAASFFQGDDLALINDIERRVFDGETIETECTRISQGRAMTYLETRIPVRDDAGEITGLLGVSCDLTDWKTTDLSHHVSVTQFKSPGMRVVMNSALSASLKDTTVLLLGESGCGKDFLSRVIHDNSARCKGPYFSINCAALVPQLAESELFGHERGAFTGAHGRKRGLLEMAEGGTLLLNEIGELPPNLQAKLLTFLDTKRITRVGGEKQVSVNARLIAATNRDLRREVEEGRFRKDLFYRINVMSITVPPLRERTEDIPILIREIVLRLVREFQMSTLPVIDSETMNQLKSYAWPGNVRELRNVLERGLILSSGRRIDFKQIGIGFSINCPNKAWLFTAPFTMDRSLNEVTADLKRSFVNEALNRAGGRRQAAAKMLGISRYSLKHYMKSFGLTDED
ncbi:MAG: sigma 54-interacting transcriptional regulator [Desulfomonile tiedjei]|uniref:Sigma 54-interacting transcriptional regulator n=1 Tax=Desulfomonile tiedjei TaxID=2358 RepID=A0A9D6V6I3_9BACT|nr:sigma 54-interacting transcriptional regulator [Desulfomonile tiedjei]